MCRYHKFHLWNSTCISTYACILSLHYTKPCISTNTHKNMIPDDGTVATPHERPPLLRGHFHTTFRVAAGEGFYCSWSIACRIQTHTPHRSIDTSIVSQSRVQLIQCQCKSRLQIANLGINNAFLIKSSLFDHAVYIRHFAQTLGQLRSESRARDW